MTNKKILFIVEGPVDEQKLIEKSMEVYGVKQQYEIYSYNTTLHELIRKLFLNNEFDDEIELLLLLKENEKDDNKRKILSQLYTDIFLIFDFDPHYQCTMFDKIKVMLRFFNDSTNNGKLYINYPMMQSYKHLKKMPDKDFKYLQVEVGLGSDYKGIADKESKYRNINQYNYITFTSIMLHHLMKANYILTSNYNIMSVDDFLRLDYIQLLEKELQLVRNERKSRCFKYICI